MKIYKIVLELKTADVFDEKFLENSVGIFAEEIAEQEGVLRVRSKMLKVFKAVDKQKREYWLDGKSKVGVEKELKGLKGLKGRKFKVYECWEDENDEFNK